MPDPLATRLAGIWEDHMHDGDGPAAASQLLASIHAHAGNTIQPGQIQAHVIRELYDDPASPLADDPHIGAWLATAHNALDAMIREIQAHTTRRKENTK